MLSVLCLECFDPMVFIGGFNKRKTRKAAAKKNSCAPAEVDWCSMAGWFISCWCPRCSLSQMGAHLCTPHAPKQTSMEAESEDIGRDGGEL